MSEKIKFKRSLTIALIVFSMVVMFFLGGYVKHVQYKKEKEAAYMQQDEMANLSQTLTWQAGEIMELENEIKELEFELKHANK